MIKYIVVLMTLLLIVGCNTGASEVTASPGVCIDNTCGTDVELNDDYFRIPVSEVTQNMKVYSYDAEGTIVNYFLVKDTNGNIKTAFDACEVCGGSKGYTQQGNDVVCNNCGRHFAVDSIGTENLGGGCWPAYLDYKIEDNEILINKNDLKASSYLFA